MTRKLLKTILLVLFVSSVASKSYVIQARASQIPAVPPSSKYQLA